MDFTSEPASGGDIVSSATAHERGKSRGPCQRLLTLKPWLLCKNYAQVPEDFPRATTTIRPKRTPPFHPRPAPTRGATNRRLRRCPKISRKMRRSPSKTSSLNAKSWASPFRYLSCPSHVTTWMMTTRRRRCYGRPRGSTSRRCGWRAFSGKYMPMKTASFQKWFRLCPWPLGVGDIGSRARRTS